jgi:hypothetical protein
MADVTGQFGQEDIVLNNAATEATLKQILEMQKIIAANAAKGFKNGADLDQSLRDLAQKTRDAAKAGKKFTEGNLRSYVAQEKNTKALKENTDVLRSKMMGLASVIRKVATGGLEFLKRVSAAASGLSTMDGSLSNATSTIAAVAGSIPGLGMAAQATAAALAPTVAALDKTRDAFQQAAAVGANFSGNLNGVVTSAAKMGLTLTEYSNMVASNGEALMFLGGSTAEGAKKLAKFGEGLKKSPVFNDLARLGYSTEAMNEGFLNYSKMLAKNGRLEGQTEEQLREGTAEYMKNLDAVSKLTGKTKEALQAEADARQADAQYRIMMSKLNPKQQAEMEKLMNSIPAAHRAGLKEILATGTATTQAGIDAMTYLRNSGNEAQNIFRQIESGNLQEGFSDRFYDIYAKDAEAFAKSSVGQTLGLFDDKLNEFYVAAADVSGRQKKLAEIVAENEKALEDAKKGVKLTEDGEAIIDPATIELFRTQINTAANNMTASLNQISIKPLTDMFAEGGPVDLAVKNVPKILNEAVENIKIIQAGAIAAEAALFALESAAFAAALAMGAQGLMSIVKGPLKLLGKAFTGSANAIGNVGKKLLPKAVTNLATKPGVGGSLLRGAGAAARFAGPIAAIASIGYAGFKGVQAGMNAEDYLGLDEGEAATMGERFSAGAGAFVETLSFGLLDGKKMAEKLVNLTGAGINTMEEYEAEIAKEKARLERSLAGEDEYGIMDGGLGRESYGQQQSRARILELERKIAEAKEEELKKQREAGNQMPAQFAGGTLGSLNKLFGNFGEGTPAMLHGMEAVVTPMQMAEVVASGVTGTMRSFIGSVQNMLTADEEKATKDLMSAGTATASVANPIGSSQSTNSQFEIMKELNSSIQELVGLTRINNTLTQRHIGVTSGLTSDAFTV